MVEMDMGFNVPQSKILVLKKTKLFSKNVRKIFYCKISEITQKSQKSTSNFHFFFGPRSKFWNKKLSYFQIM